MNHRAQQHPMLDRIRWFLAKYPQVLVYLAILGVFFFSLWLDNENQQADQARAEKKAQADLIQRCEASVDTRNVDRDQTYRFYTFVRGVVPQTDAEIEKLPEPQRTQTKKFIADAQVFRDQSFASIKPSKQCAPYVDDDNVTPEQWAKTHPPEVVRRKP